jgi:hypothetical protein
MGVVVVQLPDCTSIVYLYNFGPSALSWTPTSFSATFLAPFPYSCPSPNRRATYTAPFPWASSLIPIRESCTDSFDLAFWVFCFFSFASCCSGACHACLCAKFIVVQSFNLKKTLVNFEEDTCYSSFLDLLAARFRPSGLQAWRSAYCNCEARMCGMVVGQLLMLPA